MVKITKVYTKTGDKGMTHLAGSHRVSKMHPRVEVFGLIDELNSFLGWAIEAMKSFATLNELRDSSVRIQQRLFDLGASVAVLADDKKSNTPHVTEKDIKQLENEIDTMNKDLPSLTSFILPGGGEVSTRLHIARTVCRRAEREMLRLLEQEEVGEVELPYLNRLSDWLFVTARFVAVKLNEKETLWEVNKVL